MGRRKLNNGRLKRVGSQIVDSRMRHEDVSKFYKGRSCSLDEALMRAAVATRPHIDTPRALGKPQQEIRVVPASAVPARGTKSTRRSAMTEFNAGGSRRTVRAKSPESGLPWVKGPEKEELPVAPPPIQIKKSIVKPKKNAKKKKNKKKLPSMNKGQLRSEGGIKFVQGGLPFLGKRN